MDENTPQSTGYDSGYPAAPNPVPPAFAVAPRPRLLSKAAIAGIAVASVLSIGAATGGVLATASLVSAVVSSRQTTTVEAQTPFGSGTQQYPDYSQQPQFPQYGQQEVPGDDGASSDSTSTAQTEASDEQSVGIVLIETEIGYDSGEAAGTGIVLSSSGEILTNNHVIEGSTSITVTIAATGETYSAEVVGTDATNDVALLQLDDASGLAVADLDTSDAVAVGDEVAGVGNAGGQGYLTAAAGVVTALEQEITVSDELTGAGKTLDGLIETNAAIVSGDSGGPLFDADGEVIGIDTAASSNAQNPEGYAIPIADALEIVEQIQSGVETGTVTIGNPAFLGVQLSETTGTTVEGVTIGGAIDGTPADDAGLAAGDTITALDGVAVSTSEALSAAIAAHEPGDSVTITWVDSAGASQSATVALTEGPAA